MGITIGGAAQAQPDSFSPTTVETSQTFGSASGGGGGGGGGGDDWTLDMELTAASIALHAGSGQVSTCELLYRYGMKKEPWEADYLLRAARDLIGTWVRVRQVGAQGTITLFVGQIEAHKTDLYGTGDAPSGKQLFSAVGGMRTLEKIVISSSYFLSVSGSSDSGSSDAKPSLIGWIPGMNKKDKRGMTVGNRSDADGSGNFYYGGKNIWSHLDYVNYLLSNFIQAKDDSGKPTGPTWTLTGQTSILGSMQTTLEFGSHVTALDALRHLIPVRYGVDFSVLPTDDGFEINVFALTDDESTYAGVTLPRNPKAVSFVKDAQLDLRECEVVTTTERRVDKVQVIGKRIVVCGSLYGMRSVAADINGNNTPTLVPKWGSSIQTDYLNAGGLTSDTTAGSTANDRVRKREKYQEVYRHFGAPATWDRNKGQFNAYCKPDGTISNDTPAADAKVGQYQTFVRETLSWIPLKEGFDYSHVPPIDNTSANGAGDGSGNEEACRGPIAWVYDEAPDDDGAAHFVQCDLNSIHTSRPYHDWGLILGASPNHKLARNHWTEAQLATTDLDADEQKYDYDTLVATIAIESDSRLMLSYNVPAKLAAGDGSVMTIVDEEAEAWVLLPGTIIDVDSTWNAVAPSGSGSSAVPPADTRQLIKSPASLSVLRNDTSRLALILAGAVSKYINERGRMVLTFAGFYPGGGLLGTILKTVEQGSTIRQVGAPITSIVWTLLEKPSTVIRTGYA